MGYLRTPQCADPNFAARGDRALKPYLATLALRNFSEASPRYVFAVSRTKLTVVHRHRAQTPQLILHREMHIRCKMHNLRHTRPTGSRTCAPASPPPPATTQHAQPSLTLSPHKRAHQARDVRTVGTALHNIRRPPLRFGGASQIGFRSDGRGRPPHQPYARLRPLRRRQGCPWSCARAAAARAACCPWSS